MHCTAQFRIGMNGARAESDGTHPSIIPGVAWTGPVLELVCGARIEGPKPLWRVAGGGWRASRATHGRPTNEHNGMRERVTVCVCDDACLCVERGDRRTERAAAAIYIRVRELSYRARDEWGAGMACARVHVRACARVCVPCGGRKNAEEGNRRFVKKASSELSSAVCRFRAPEEAQAIGARDLAAAT